MGLGGEKMFLMQAQIWGQLYFFQVQSSPLQTNKHFLN